MSSDSGDADHVLLAQQCLRARKREDKQKDPLARKIIVSDGLWKVLKSPTTASPNLAKYFDCTPPLSVTSSRFL